MPGGSVPLGSGSGMIVATGGFVVVRCVTVVVDGEGSEQPVHNVAPKVTRRATTARETRREGLMVLQP
jgi:hypothetical protein